MYISSEKTHAHMSKLISKPSKVINRVKGFLKGANGLMSFAPILSLGTNSLLLSPLHKISTSP